MRSKLLIASALLMLLACSDDSSNPTYPLERTVLDVSITKKCKDCYLLRWNHPIEKKDLQNYYIWLDTTVVRDSIQRVSEAQMNLADTVIAYKINSDGDSLDLTNLIEEFSGRDSLHLAIWAKYAGSNQGVVQHMYIHFGDDVRPSAVSFRDSASANSIWIDWIRPTDQSDFYDPNTINGIIAGYNVTIRAETDPTEDIRKAMVYIKLAGTPIDHNLKPFERFVKEGRGVRLESINSNDPRYLRVAIIDGKGFIEDNAEINNWRMQISGLKPERSYRVIITAYDIAGNASSEESKNIKTTDDTPPTIAPEFHYNKDSDGNATLDSNRLILSWIPSTDRSGIETYSLQILNDNAWEAIPRVSAIKSGYYTPNQGYINDTLRWVLPGETIYLRLRAIDKSGHYSAPLVETITISKGELGQYNCPPNFAPVKMSEEKVFCMEKLQYNSNGKFEKNILYIEAEEKCKNSGYRLCTESEWYSACNSRNSSYGVIEEKNESGLFPVSEFLFMHCGVGTGDSISAVNVGKRNKICASPDGIRDLPGQLQEWVTSNDGTGTPLLKGSSYAIFQGASRADLALCKNIATPTRIRPRYTTDDVYLYRTGSRIDTLRAIDTLRTLYAVLKSDSLPDTLLFYTLKSKSGTPLGEDYVNQAEYRRRGGDKWLEVLWQGLNYEFKKPPKRALIMGDTAINASNFFLDPTVGFRCCKDSN
ncbi:MAG: hypothetical protein FWC15_01055 [Fibromonadales bacterium]|nr:hypothetical protein [Fibromonadales bacterium]